MSASMAQKRKAQKWAPYLFVSPFFLLFAAFSLFPILFTLYISLTEWNGTGTAVFVGLRNYADVLGDSRFYQALGNTLLFMVMIIPAQIVLALIVSVILTSGKVPFVSAFRLANFLPYITTSVAIGLIFSILFDWQYGAVNALLMKLGIVSEPVNWLGEPGPARFVVSLVTVWKYFGYTAVLFLAGMTSISRQLYEAAELDGANRLRQFFSLTLPMLRPVMVFVVLTTMIGCFQIFDEPFMLFSTFSSSVVGGPEGSSLTGTWLIYDTVFGSTFRFGYGSAIAYVLFMIIALISIVTFKAINRGDEA